MIQRNQSQWRLNLSHFLQFKITYETQFLDASASCHDQANYRAPGVGEQTF